MLYYSKDIESFGTGLKRIADACDKAGVRYEFKKMKSGFVVCFYRNEPKIDWEKTILQSEKMSELMSKKMSEIKNEAIIKIVEYLEENGQITTDIGVEITGKSVAQVRRYLKGLCDIGFVEKNWQHKRKYIRKS